MRQFALKSKFIVMFRLCVMATVLSGEHQFAAMLYFKVPVCIAWQYGIDDHGNSKIAWFKNIGNSWNNKIYIDFAQFDLTNCLLPGYDHKNPKLIFFKHFVITNCIRLTM